jgi:hypothetical protein
MNFETVNSDAWNCDLMKTSVLGYLTSQTEVMQLRNSCVMSLPLKTLDGRWVEIYIEPTGTDRDLVHDGGKTLNFLEGSGMLVSDGKLLTLAELARRFGATFDDGVFKALARHGDVQSAVLAVAQCCMVGMYDLLKHHPVSEEEQVRLRVDRKLDAWSVATGIAVTRSVKLSGSVRQYVIDFVAESKTPVAVTILTPSYSPSVSADRFALQSLDLQNTPYSKWRKLAILASPEKWKPRARSVVEKLADEVTEMGEPDLFEDNGIPEALNKLIGKAA